MVLFVDESTAKAWTTSEILQRWHPLFKGILITQQYCRGEETPDYLLASFLETAEVYRNRLMSISWFICLLNQSIATQANQEDNCTGHFWERRFKSQTLLDEAALAVCMAYVDLTPVRANIAKTPENSRYTSVKQRVVSAKKGKQPARLLPFVGNPHKTVLKGLPFELKDYL